MHKPLNPPRALPTLQQMREDHHQKLRATTWAIAWWQSIAVGLVLGLGIAVLTGLLR